MTDHQALADVIATVDFTDGEALLTPQQGRATIFYDGTMHCGPEAAERVAAAIVAAVNEGRCPPIVPEGDAPRSTGLLTALADVAEAADEIERLRYWKAEAMEVLGLWHQVWEEAGRPGALGSSNAESMLKWVREMKAKDASLP